MAKVKDSNGFTPKKRKKRTAIGASKYSRPKNKNAKKQSKKYKGQGK